MIKQGKRYLVTGGYGFLAKNLIDKLLANGCEVTTMCRDFEKSKNLYSAYEGKVEVVVGDLLSRDTYDKLGGGDFSFPSDGGTGSLTRSISGVFHLAAARDIILCEEKPVECVKSNVIGSINVLDYSFRNKLDFCVGASTFAADKPTGAYGASKFLMEKLFSQFSEMKSDCSYGVLRFGPLLYSPGSVLCNWKKALENDEEITLTAPHATRKFVSVDHISEKLLEIPVGTQEVDSKSVRLQDLLDAFVEKYRKEGQNVKVNVSGLRGGEQLESGDAEDLCTLEDIKEMI